MPPLRFVLAVVLVLAVPVAGTAQTDDPGSLDALMRAQAAANAGAGPRKVPGRDIPVPREGVSAAIRPQIAAPYAGNFAAAPRSAEDWKAFAAPVAEASARDIPGLAAMLGVSVEPTSIAGVKAYVLTPKAIAPANRDRLALHVHGGGYVLYGGLGGTGEGVIMAGLGGIKVISVDYRMPPDFPYPAALDDCMAVWRETIKTVRPQNVGLIGTSTGGGLVLAMALRARDEKGPLPGAVAAGTPWADLSKTGDSYFTNEWLDNVLVTWDGWLGKAALLYAGGHDLKEPYLSPIYGDFAGLPPTILTTGTRDLFLSNTVRVHRKLRRAGVEADLNVYEGLSHAGFIDPGAPEGREAFLDIARFFDRHLGP
ncbi:MAG: alpha/beta hydrolase [Alsobacter sp.]